MAIQSNNITRSRVILAIFVIVFAVIVAQLLNLQLFSSKYKIQAQNNAVFRRTEYPDRGIIYDRHHRAMIDNTINYDLTVTPADARKGVDTAALCAILGIDSAEYNKRMIAAIVKNTSVKPSTFEPVLTPDLYSKLNENLYKFPGFALQERLTRTYPFNCGANFLGRLGEVSAQYLKDNPESGYQSGDYIGQTGLEKQYETVLMGQRGVTRLLRDNRGRPQGAYAGGKYDTAAVAGRNLYTSIDMKVQQLGEKMFQGKIGAAVAINPKTGGIIAMVTAPSYNPNDLSPTEYKKNINFLVTDTSAPMLNRAIAGGYPPGSTYKPMGALVGLDEGIITPASGYPCMGAYYGCNTRIRCDEHWAGHAANLKLAIANSCNSFFCNLFKNTVDNPAYGSSRKGYAVWRNYMHGFGLGKQLGVDIPGEKTGNIPDTTEYNRDYGPRWVGCNMVTMGIGQDRMLLTPLQSANEACIIANKGWYYTPHFVDSIEFQTDDDTVYLAKYRVKHQQLHISDEDYRTVQAGMEDVTEVGTAKNISIPGIKYAAKTGTAQVPRLKNLAVFIAYAPADNPKIAMAVYVENAGYGATWAAPIAAHMMEQYLNDTLTADSQNDVERLSKINLYPPQIFEWRRKDSLRQMEMLRKAKELNDSVALVKRTDSLRIAAASKQNKNSSGHSSSENTLQPMIDNKRTKNSSKPQTRNR